MLSEAKHLVHQPSQPAAPEMRGPGHAPVMLSEAKHLDGLQFRSFAALRTTGHKDLLRPSWHVAPGGRTIPCAGESQP